MTERLTFEDVLDELMLREPKPTYEALLRWQERYPQYREALTEFFATWGIQAARAEASEQTVIDEERIAQEGVAHVMETLRKQGRLISKDSIPSLAPFDQLVLAAIYLLQGQGYPAKIATKVSEMSGSEALLGSVFASIKRLEAQSLVVVRREVENNTRRYFTVTMAGERALAQAKETSTVVARFLPDFA